MTEPVIAGRAPLPIDVTAGKDYFWCSCGQSTKQPFCDGSHAGSTFTPQKWTAPETKTAYFCACKHTANAPLCDGAHARLAD